MLKPQDLVPFDIKLTNVDSETVSLNDLKGQYLVVYFYPADDTPTCTTEACSFRDFNSEIERLEVKVIGVSPDSVKSHMKFKNKHQLNFEL